MKWRNTTYLSVCLAISLAVVFCLAGWPGRSAAGDLQVQAVVETNQVMVGESFLLEISVEGDDQPEPPDLSGLAGFRVQDRGSRQNNSESITIVNGQMNRVSHRGYIFAYSLTPDRAGKLVIPAIPVRVAGKTMLTAPIPIKVGEPKETDDFKLRMNLSKNEAFVGEPVLLTVTWYLNKNVREFGITLPVLDPAGFKVDNWPALAAVANGEIIEVPVDGEAVQAVKGNAVFEGIQYTTVTFKKVLIPRQPGNYRLDRAMVQSRAVVGYRQKQRRFPYDDFFSNDLFGPSRQEVYQTFVTPSNQPELTVYSLPDNGRPADFSGLVGSFRIAAEAEPLAVNVGDPITLKLYITGTDEYLAHVELPDLALQPDLGRDFKVPAERAPGEAEGRVKRYIQTIRPNNAAIKTIPSVLLHFFNPLTRKYETAATDPIPLEVRETRVVTALDAEGGAPTGPTGSRITSLRDGIAYNFEGGEVLANQEYVLVLLSRSWQGLLLLAGPPVAFMLTYLLVIFARRRQDPVVLRFRQAYPLLQSSLRQLGNYHEPASVSSRAGNLAETLRKYLGDKLNQDGSTIIYQDVAGLLKARGVEDAVLNDLQEVFNWCETQQYAGSGQVSNADSFGPILKMAERATAAIERVLQ